MKVKLPTFLQVDPLAKFIAQKMREEPDEWDLSMTQWEYNGRIKLNSHSLQVDWPAPKKFNYVSRQHLRAACSDLVLHHEDKRRQRHREIDERNNAKVWEAMLGDKPPKDKPLGPIQTAHQSALAQMAMSNSANNPHSIAGMANMPMTNYYENLEREQSAFLQEYLRKTARYHQDSTGRGAT